MILFEDRMIENPTSHDILPIFLKYLALWKSDSPLHPHSLLLQQLWEAQIRERVPHLDFLVSRVPTSFSVRQAQYCWVSAELCLYLSVSVARSVSELYLFPHGNLQGCSSSRRLGGGSVKIRCMWVAREMGCKTESYPQSLTFRCALKCGGKHWINPLRDITICFRKAHFTRHF